MAEKTRVKIARTGAGLRDSLFDMLERLRDRDVDSEEAQAFAKVASEIVKSAQVQLNFEQLKLENKIPSNLSDMNLVPPLTQIDAKPTEQPVNSSAISTNT